MLNPHVQKKTLLVWRTPEVRERERQSPHPRSRSWLYRHRSQRSPVNIRWKTLHKIYLHPSARFTDSIATGLVPLQWWHYICNHLHSLFSTQTWHTYPIEEDSGKNISSSSIWSRQRRSDSKNSATLPNSSHPSGKEAPRQRNYESGWKFVVSPE